MFDERSFRMTGTIRNTDRERSRLFAQVAAILFYFVLFVDAAAVFRKTVLLPLPVLIITLVFLNGAFIASLLTALFFARRVYIAIEHDSFRLDGRTLLAFSRKHLPIIVVAVLFAVLALLQFDTIQRFDAGLYYSPLITATETFQFNFESIFSSFALSKHPTQGFALLIGAGEMLFPKQSIGVYWVTLLVSLSGLLCLYNLIGHLMPRTTHFERAAGTAIFIFCPYVLGLFSYTTPDYYLTMFFVIMIWAFHHKLHLLCAFMALLVSFSKEPGILFASSFLLTAVIVEIVRIPGKGFSRKAIQYLWPARLLLYGFVPAFYLFYFKFYGSMNFATSVTNESPLRWDNNGIHCFGFSLPYISARLMQLLVYNFFWIPLLLGSIALLLFLYRSRKYQEDTTTTKGNHATESDTIPNPDVSDVASAAGIAVASLAYLIFTCLFITHLCPRYAVCFALPAALACVWATRQLPIRQILAAGLLSIIALLFVGQCYAELDPSINLTCRGLDIGKVTIYSPTTSWYDTQYNLSIVSEMYVHNRLYAYADDLGTQTFSRLSITENDTFVYVGLDFFEMYFVGDPIQTDHQIYWDPATGRRTYEDNIEGSFIPKYRVLSAIKLEGDVDLDLPDRFYFLNLHHASASYLDDLLRRGFEVTDSFVVENAYGSIDVYTLERID
jgi:hypothetical protein